MQTLLALPSYRLDEYNYLLLIIVFIVLGSLSLSDNVKNLKKAAHYGFYAIIVMIFAVFYLVLFDAYKSEINVDTLHSYNFYSLGDGGSVTSNLAIIILSFSFHTYTFSIYECLDNPSTKKMMVSSSIGILISTVIYLVVGSSIYLTYGDKIVDDDIFQVLSGKQSGLFIIVSFCISVVMSFPISFFSIKSYALYILPYIRDIISGFICGKKEEKKHDDSDIRSNSTTKALENFMPNKTIIEEGNEEDEQSANSEHSNDSDDENERSNQVVLATIKGEKKDHDDSVAISDHHAHSHGHGHDDHEHHHHPEELSFVSKICVTILMFVGLYFICLYLKTMKYVRFIILYLDFFILGFNNSKFEYLHFPFPFLHQIQQKQASFFE